LTDERPTILVVDDDASLRASLRDLFESIGLQVGVFESTQDFLRGGRPAGPCCLVLDVRLPGRSGLDFQRDLKQAKIRLPIIFLTGHGDIPMSVRAMKDGAVEFLTKPFREQELLEAVQQALEADRRALADERLVATLRQRFEALTPREQTVMALVVAGRMNKQIAVDIGTSEVTAKVHRANMMRKMQAITVADLVGMAGKLDLPAHQPTKGS
jgi:FixJ family two-component response regulator